MNPFWNILTWYKTNKGNYIHAKLCPNIFLLWLMWLVPLAQVWLLVTQLISTSKTNFGDLVEFPTTKKFDVLYLPHFRSKIQFHLHKILLVEGFPTISRGQCNFPLNYFFGFIQFSKKNVQ